MGLTFIEMAGGHDRQGTEEPSRLQMRRNLAIHWRLHVMAGNDKTWSASLYLRSPLPTPYTRSAHCRSSRQASYARCIGDDFTGSASSGASVPGAKGRFILHASGGAWIFEPGKTHASARAKCWTNRNVGSPRSPMNFPPTGDPIAFSRPEGTRHASS